LLWKISITVRAVHEAQGGRGIMRFEVRCPHCGEKLTDSEHKINGDRGFEVKVKTEGKEGTIWISHHFGNLVIDSGDIEIEDKAVVEFFCPKCKEKLTGNGLENEESKEGHVRGCKCEECKAPMVHLELKITAKMCSRRGCGGVKIGGKSPSTSTNTDQGDIGTFFW
jgi:hypothetical protein